MTNKPGATVPESGIYWCSVCKTPASFQKGQEFPECRNMCGKGHWEKAPEPKEG